MIFDKLLKKDEDSGKTAEAESVSAVDYYAEGKAQFYAGHYTQAMEYFQAAIAEHPERENVYLKLADTFLAMGKQKEASSTLYKLLARYPDSAQAQEMLKKCQSKPTPEPPQKMEEVSFNNDDEPARINSRTASNISSDAFSVDLGMIKFNMIRVEGGSFMMGSPDNDSDAEEDEMPQHRVTLSDYYIGETQVTQALWKAVMGTTVRQQRPKEFRSLPMYGEGDNYPMYYISWDESLEFVHKLNQMTGKTFRLPTEAEWEYAARGGRKSQGYKYAGSNDIDKVAWYDKNSGYRTHPVKQKSANELGLYDMSGNVWEWCQDLYDDYSDCYQANPTGAYVGLTRVIRGGCFEDSARICRVACRSHDVDVGGEIGVRLALSKKKNTSWLFRKILYLFTPSNEANEQ